MPSKMGKGILVTSTYHGNLLLGPDAIDEDGTVDRSTHVDRLYAIYQAGLHTTSKIDHQVHPQLHRHPGSGLHR